MLHLRNTDFMPVLEPLKGFSGPSKRRIYKAEEKARIVAESFACGESVCSVARRHGLMASQLFAWRKNARRQREDSRLGAQSVEFPGLKPAAFVDERQFSTQAAPIEITIGPAIVRVPQGFDAATLKVVLQTLNAGLVNTAR